MSGSTHVIPTNRGENKSVKALEHPVWKHERENSGRESWTRKKFVIGRRKMGSM
jgi:hypothetical protein